MPVNTKIPKSRKKTFYDRRKKAAVRTNDNYNMETLSQKPFEVKDNTNIYQSRENLDRRNIKKDRRQNKSGKIDIDRRKKERRQQNYEDYSNNFIQERRMWLEEKYNVKLEHVSKFSFDPQNIRKNVENFIGAAQVPIGVAGPLKIHGESAKGEFFVPFATTEGTMIKTYQMGMQIIALSGGVKVKLLKDNTHISPIFVLDNVDQSIEFKDWILENYDEIKDHAEATTSHGKLLSIEPRVRWNKVVLVFNYFTGDATGQNMTVISADNACRFISKKTGYRYYVKSNFSSDKKVSWYNYISGYGKTVQASVVIPNKIVHKVLKSSPREISEFYKNNVADPSAAAGMTGIQGQFANGLAGVFIACGQDVANLVHSSTGSITHEVTKNNDLFSAVHLPSLMVGTVGSGTNFGTSKECLDLLGCFGKGKAKKFAEICAGVCLAGEIAIAAALTNNTYSQVHDKYRKK